MMILWYKNLYFARSIDSDLPSSPQSSEPGREDSPLNLINALAACVLSAKLSPLYKQWAVKEFIQVWFKLNTSSVFWYYFYVRTLLVIAKTVEFCFFYCNSKIFYIYQSKKI